MRNALPLQSFLALLGWRMGSLGVCVRAAVSPGELPKVVDQQGEKEPESLSFFRGIFSCLLVECFPLSCKTLTLHLE